MKNKAQRWVFAALLEISAAFPFPIRGIDSDNGSEPINAHLLRYCDDNKITFTRSRPGNKNDGAHIEIRRDLLARVCRIERSCDLGTGNLPVAVPDVPLRP